MDRGPVIQIDGMREIRRTLRKAGDDLDDLKQANAQAASIAGDGGKARSPFRFGTLRGSIRTAGTKTAGIIRAGRKTVPYANPIHWGWPTRNIEPNPFLAAGAQHTEPQWLPVYLDTLETIMKQVKGA